MSEYNVVLKRDGRFWLVYIEGVKGLTQARRYSEAELMAREYISLVNDEPFDSVQIRSVTIAEVTEKIEHAAAEREKARVLEAAASADFRDVAQGLRAESVPLVEIGQILGVSHQRAHQLVSG